MVINETDNVISVTDASESGLSALLRQAEEGRDRILVRNNEAVAVVMSVERFEQMQQLQDDLYDITLVAARSVTTSGPSVSLDDVIERFGFTRDELASIPDKLNARH
jgi:prevent-host-death family protein